MNVQLQVVQHTETAPVDPKGGKPPATHNVILQILPVDDDEAKKSFVGDPIGHVHLSNLSDTGFAGLNLGTTHALAPAAAPTPTPDKPPVPGTAPGVVPAKTP